MAPQQHQHLSIEKMKTWEHVENLSTDLSRAVMQRDRTKITELITVLGLMAEHLETN